MFGLNTYGGLGLALLVAGVVVAVVIVLGIVGVGVDRVAAGHEDQEGR